MIIVKTDRYLKRDIVGMDGKNIKESFRRETWYLFCIIPLYMKDTIVPLTFYDEIT